MDVLIDIKYNLHSSLRASAVWACNSATMAALSKLKNDNGDYYLDPNPANGVREVLQGSRIEIIESMPDIGANAYPIVYGAFNPGIQGRVRQGLEIQRLDERYAEQGKIGYIATMRAGAVVSDPQYFVPLQCATS
jgi:HK97 family phage major capsid protein